MKKIVSIALLLSGLGFVQMDAYDHKFINETPFTLNFSVTHQTGGNSKFSMAPGQERVHKTSAIMNGIDAQVETHNIAPAWTPPGWKDPNPGKVEIKANRMSKSAGMQNRTIRIRGPLAQGSAATQDSPSLYKFGNRTAPLVVEQWDISKAPVSDKFPHYIYPAGTKTNGDNTFAIICHSC